MKTPSWPPALRTASLDEWLAALAAEASRAWTRLLLARCRLPSLVARLYDTRVCVKAAASVWRSKDASGCQHSAVSRV